jgi:hypothetical protein
MLDCFCGDAFISFEGDLSKFDFGQIRDVMSPPTEVLRCQTIWPKQEFVILPVEDDTKTIIQRTILPRIGLRRRVLHVQIAKTGQLEFAAYDCFHPDTVWVSQNVSEVLLQSLISDKAIWSFSKS